MNQEGSQTFSNEREWKLTKVVDLSGYNDPEYPRYRPNYLRENLLHLRGVARKIVVMPDFGPTGKNMVPTGTVTEFDTKAQPEWLKFVKGADIGCGMTGGKFKSGVEKADFMKHPELLDEVTKKIISLDSAAIGGGNHFLDFVEMEGQIGVIVHTGSHGDQQNDLGMLVGDSEKWWKKYHTVIASAKNNRQVLLDTVSSVFGKVDDKDKFELIHNTVELKNEIATVYKGTIKVEKSTKQLVLPSSMTGPIMVFAPGEAINESTLFAAPHGTGRKISRSEAKSKFRDENGLPVRDGNFVHIGDTILMVPSQIKFLPVTELPDVYYKAEEALSVLLDKGLITDDYQTWYPVAYVGHLPGR